MPARRGRAVRKVSPDLWRDMLAVNLDGMFHCCQLALPDLLAAQAGRIVTVASMAGLHGFAYAAPISRPSMAPSASPARWPPNMRARACG
jgi:NAD(P)-dependent dehydrogenase (short-subunit alcohol dehydrogenase family)